MVMRLLKKYPLIILMTVSLLMLLSHLGAVQTNIMEARNLIAAREIISNNDWVFTTLNNHPRYEKPPLPTWMTAIVGSFTRFENMFFLRLPAVLVTLMMLYFFYKFLSKQNLQNNQNLVGSLILITSFYIFFSGRDNQWDIYAHAFMMASIYYLFKSFKDSQNTSFDIALSGIFFGFSFLSKGPVSSYALFLPFVLSYLIVYKSYFKNLKLTLYVLIIGLIIGLSWPLYVRYFDATAFSEATTREATRWAGYNTRPFYYYWSFFTQSGIWTIPSFIALLYPYMKNKIADLKAYQFSFLWTILGVVLLSLIPEKKSRYLLPILVPMAYNTSFYISYLITDFNKIKSKKELWSIYFSFGIIGMIAIGMPILLFTAFGQNIFDYLFWFLMLSFTSLTCGIAIILGLRRKNFNLTFYSIIAFMTGIMAFGIPISKAYYTNPNYFSAKCLKDFEKKYTIRTYEAGGFVPEIIWDYGSSIPEIDSNQKRTTPNELRFGLLASPDNFPWIKTEFENYTIEKMAVVDLNQVDSGKKNYNKRLVKNYYLLISNYDVSSIMNTYAVDTK